MKVAGDGGQRPAGFRNGFEGVVKETFVIGFKLEASVGCEEAGINIHENRTGQTAVRLAVLRPRIREIQVDAVHLAGGEDIRQQAGIDGQEGEIPKLGALRHPQFPLLQSLQKDGVIALDADVVDVRMQYRHLLDELTLAHADLYVKRMVIAEKCLPLSLLCFWGMGDIG